MLSKCWKDVQKEIPPMNKDILVTNGKEIALCSLWKTDIDDYVHMAGVGFGGYEWEFNFDYNDITHWMPSPDLPKHSLSYP